MNMLESVNCIVCGENIDPEIALLNTGVSDCCDFCSINRREEYRRNSKVSERASTILSFN